MYVQIDENNVVKAVTRNFREGFFQVDDNIFVVPEMVYVDSVFQNPEPAPFTSEQILKLRKVQYQQRVDPIRAEAEMERLLGDETRAAELDAYAVEEYLAIKEELPFPIEGA